MFPWDERGLKQPHKTLPALRRGVRQILLELVDLWPSFETTEPTGNLTTDVQRGFNTAGGLWNVARNCCKPYVVETSQESTNRRSYLEQFRPDLNVAGPTSLCPGVG